MNMTLQAPNLQPTEWQAIRVALRDAEADGSACAARSRPGRCRRLYWLLVGEPPRPPLADARLEALRRFVCMIRHVRGATPELTAELAGHGYTFAQIEAIAYLAL